MGVTHKINLKCDRCGREEHFEFHQLDDFESNRMEQWKCIELDEEPLYIDDVNQSEKYLCPTCSEEYDKLTRTFIKHTKLAGLIFSDDKSTSASVIKW